MKHVNTESVVNNFWVHFMCASAEQTNKQTSKEIRKKGKEKNKMREVKKNRI